MEISIIIPVYNGEKYLERCVKSVLASLEKSAKTGEILLIDNGSSDNSLQIAKRLHKNHAGTVQVFQCKTPGASAVRNFGVAKSQGEYIWFIDDDDEIAPNAIGLLCKKAAQTKADFIMFGAEKVLLNGTRQPLPALNAASKEFKSQFIRREIGPWQVIIRKKWYQENGFSFREGIIHEDMEMMPALILYTNNYANVKETLYYYYETPGSVLHKATWDSHVLDIFPALEGLYERFKRANATKQYHDELEWFFIWNLLVDSARDFSRFPEGKVGFRRARQMFRKYFPAWRRNRFMRRQKRAWRFWCLMQLHYWGIC